MAREAVAAFTAGNVMGHEHAVAHPYAVHARTELDDLCGDLVSQDERRLRLPVPLQDVGAADAARTNLDQDLSGSDPWLREVDDPYVVVRVVHRGAHGAPTSSASRPSPNRAPPSGSPARARSNGS